MKKVLLSTSIVLLLSACAIQPPQQNQRGPVGILMAEAGQQATGGQHHQAIALLERAVRIEPRNGQAWLRLARLHFASGDLSKADQFARRAKQFAGADKNLQRKCQVLLDKISKKINKPS